MISNTPARENGVTRLANAPTDLPLDAFNNNHYWIINGSEIISGQLIKQ